MQTAVQDQRLSVEDFRASEQTSEVGQEYVGGFVHAIQTSLPLPAIYEGV